MDKTTDWNRSFPIRTVCEVTREINDLLTQHRSLFPQALFRELKFKLDEQMTMQKKMDKKLREYCENVGSDLTYDYMHIYPETNPNHKQIEAKRKKFHAENV